MLLNSFCVKPGPKKIRGTLSIKHSLTIMWLAEFIESKTRTNVGLGLFCKLKKNLKKRKFGQKEKCNIWIILKMLRQSVPQNFTFTSRATELGRGPKTVKMDNAPEWTPGPGEYPT